MHRKIMSNPFFHPFLNLFVKWCGKQDSRSDPPIPFDDTPPPIIKRLAMVGNSSLNYLLGKWLKKDKRLEKDLLKRLLIYKYCKQNLTETKLNYENALKHYMNITGQPEEVVSNPFSFYYKLQILNNIFYYIFIVVLCALEFPLNITAFKIFPETIDYAFFALAIGVSLTVIASGHLTGAIIRREDYYNPHKYKNHKLYIKLLTILPICIIIFLAAARAFYFFENQVDISVSLASIGLFIIINGAFYVTTLIYSWKVHESIIREPGFMVIYTAKAKHAIAKKKLKHAIIKLDKAEITRINHLKRYAAKAKSVENETLRLEHLYHQYNLIMRDKSKGHSSKFNEINVEMPSIFKEGYQNLGTNINIVEFFGIRNDEHFN